MDFIKWGKYVTIENFNKNPANESSLLLVKFNINSIEHILDYATEDLTIILKSYLN